MGRRWSSKILGPLELCRDGRVVALGGGKPRALLAVLLLHANEPVSVERLAGAVWGEDAPAASVRTVRVHVSRLRRALGVDAVLTTTAAGYRLGVRPGELDAERFERLLVDGRRALADGRPQDAGELLREALALWRGPALADLAVAPFAQVEIERLEEQRLAAIEVRFEADLAMGRHAELVAELKRLTGGHPLRERLHGQLMLALYRCGRQGDALAAYRDARAVLVERLGIEPGSELRALEQAILAQELILERGKAEAALATSTPSAHRARVPLPPTPTVGREAELSALRALVEAGGSRLVTVVGPGGVGKTRIAIELAHLLGPTLRDGAVFVPLGALSAAQHVASTVTRELGVAPAPRESAEDALRRHRSQREQLLVLDNFEHLLDAAVLVANLLAGAPGLRVLATSREPLRVRAERLFHLDPLAVTSELGARKVAPAVALFVGAVRARDPGFGLSEEQLPAVLEVCGRVDGLPLALELAAGRVGLLSVSELVRRLRTGLEALNAAPRDAPGRQRTLNATLQWSFDLLGEDERRALVGLAVFAGGCTLEAARAVTGATDEVLESLVAKNLLLADARSEAHSRVAMLETVRAFARCRLKSRSDDDARSRAHCEHYLALAEQTRPELERTASTGVLAELDREVENLRAAFGWALEHSPELALRLASATAFYWFLSEIDGEGRAWLAAALDRAGESAAAAVRAEALEHYAINLAKPGTIEEAERAARESLALRRSLEDASGCARSTWVLATVLMQAFRSWEAYELTGEAQRLADGAGDEQARVWALGLRAMMAPTVQEALVLGGQAAAAHRSAGNRRELASLQTCLAYTALIRGDHAAAEPLSRQALDAARAYGAPFVLPLAQGHAGLAALFNGRLKAAQQAFASEVRLGAGHGFDSDYAGFLFEGISGLAAVAAERGNERTAAVLTGAGDAVTLERHDPAIARRLEERFFVPARARIGQQAWQQAYASGTTLSPQQAIQVALKSVDARAVASPPRGQSCRDAPVDATAGGVREG